MPKLRYAWIFIVLGAISTVGQNAYGPDFLNLHCTAPDPLAQTLFNIQPRSGLVPDRSANGNVVLYCDASSGTFKASFNGGAYASLANSALPTGATGSVLASQGVGIQTIFQTKPTIDARDIGVDCSFTNNSSTALNALTLTGSTLIFPPGCHVKLTSMWLIKNQSNFTISGASRGSAQGQALGTVISWCGASSSGPVMDFEFSGWGTIEGITVETQGTGCANSALTSINVDKTGGGGTGNTTDLLFQRISAVPNLGGIVPPSGWIGIAFSLVSGVNVEDMRVRDSNITCQNGTNSTGIMLGPSFNAKNEEFVHDIIGTGCTTGIFIQNGSAKIEMNEFTTAGVDIKINTVADPNTVIVGNLSESSGAFLNFPTASGSPALPIEVSGNSIPIHNGICAVDTGNSNLYTRLPNAFFNVDAAGDSGPYICNSFGQPPTIVGQFALFSTGTTPNPFPAAFLATRPLLRGPFWWNTYSDVLLSGGYTLSEKTTFYSSSENQDGLSSVASGNQNQTPCGTNTYCAFEGEYELTGVPTPSNFNSAITGADTSTQYGFMVSALDANGNETLLRGGQPFLNVHGPATFDGSHFITLTWNTSASAASCNVYAVNVSNATQLNKIGSAVTCGTFQVNSYPGTFPITTIQTGQNKTLVQNLRGRIQLQDMGQCTMSTGTCTAQTLSSKYTSPKCFLTWTGTGTLTGILKAPTTTNTVTPASSVNTDTAVVNWACYE